MFSYPSLFKKQESVNQTKLSYCQKGDQSQICQIVWHGVPPRNPCHLMTQVHSLPNVFIPYLLYKTQESVNQIKLSYYQKAGKSQSCQIVCHGVPPRNPCHLMTQVHSLPKVFIHQLLYKTRKCKPDKTLLLAELNTARAARLFGMVSLQENHAT